MKGRTEEEKQRQQQQQRQEQEQKQRGCSQEIAESSDKGQALTIVDLEGASMQSEDELVSAVREEAAEADQAGESVRLTARDPDPRPDKGRSANSTLPS